MTSKHIYFYVGFLSFLIGVCFAYYFAFHRTYDLETGNNVCQKCLDVSKAENLETKTLSEILNDRSLNGKKVRLKARFGHDAGRISLYNSNHILPSAFAKDSIPCEDTEKTLMVCTGYKDWYDSSVDLLVVGYFGNIEDESSKLEAGVEGFNIICVEKVEATKEEIVRGKQLFENDPFFVF